MIKIQRKKTVLALSAMALFLSVGSAYAYVKTHQKSKGTLLKKAEAKKADNAGQAAADISSEQPAAATDADAPAQTVAVQTASTQPSSASQYPIHRNISTTFFWAGEEAGKDNKNISNLPSAWDDQWVKHFGGVDDPNKRSGFVVASFTPKENSFYFALPYNDFDGNGNRKKDVNKIIPWASSKKWADTESMLKNQWIKITKGGKTAYAQWQDVGPFGEDDSAYVFGGAAPKSKTNADAGLDVSPAVKDFLGLGDVDKTDWQFISADQVPDGPWKKTITSSQVYWN